MQLPAISSCEAFFLVILHPYPAVEEPFQIDPLIHLSSYRFRCLLLPHLHHTFLPILSSLHVHLILIHHSYLFIPYNFIFYLYSFLRISTYPDSTTKYGSTLTELNAAKPNTVEVIVTAIANFFICEHSSSTNSININY